MNHLQTAKANLKIQERLYELSKDKDCPESQYRDDYKRNIHNLKRRISAIRLNKYWLLVEHYNTGALCYMMCGERKMMSLKYEPNSEKPITLRYSTLFVDAVHKGVGVLQLFLDHYGPNIGNKCDAIYPTYYLHNPYSSLGRSGI